MKRFTQTLYLLFISLLFLVGLSFSALAGEESAEKGTDCSSLETHSLENGKSAYDNCGMDNKEASDRKKISEMNDEELKQFLEDYVFTENYVCVEYPEYKDGMFALLKNYLHEFDSNGTTAIPLNFKLYHLWAEKIDTGIEKYYDGAIFKKGLPGLPKPQRIIQRKMYLIRFRTTCMRLIAMATLLVYMDGSSRDLPTMTYTI